MADPGSRARFVVLGASNVAFGLDALVARIRGLAPGPVEILSAHGHGRSYGVTTKVLFRELPSIGESGLWRALDAAPGPVEPVEPSDPGDPGETAGAIRAGSLGALVTDIGNDLAYGSSVDVVARWVERDLERLQRRGARIVLGRMPIASLERIAPLRFRIVKSILFPGRPIELPRLLDAARALDERLLATARARGIATFEPRTEWYGIDPIHVRPSMRAEASRAALAAFEGTSRGRPDERIGGAIELVKLRGLRPEFQRFLGRERRAEQPSLRFADGSSVAWY